jgi:putative cardiolipin synthase
MQPKIQDAPAANASSLPPSGPARPHRGLRARIWVGLTVLALLSGCATPPFRPSALQPTHAFEQPERSTLARLLAPESGSDPQASTLRLLATGHEAFAARAALAETAEHTLDLQYYIVDHDETATLLLQRLLRAAQRGVRVRLLVDDLDTRLSESDIAALALHPMIEVRLFNPFRARGSVARVLEWLGGSKRLNQRMHNKLWIADNAAAVIGGRNLGDAYFDASPEEAFSDLDLLVAGPAVREASASFDRYWNSSWAVPLAEVVAPPADSARVLHALDARAKAFLASDYVRALRATEFGRQLRYGPMPMITARARILADPPPRFDETVDTAAPAAERTSAIFPALRAAVSAAQHEVIMVTPYLVPSDRSVEVLCALPARGVAVRLLTNSLASTDVPAVHAGYARYRPRLLACGVQLFELRPAAGDGGALRQRLSSGASLHAKAVVVDRQWVLMGSMNLDARSRHLNTEVALQVDSAALGAQMGALFDASTTLDQVWQPSLARAGDAGSGLRWQGLDNGQLVISTEEPGASLWRHAAAALLGWLIDESLL